MGHRAYMDIIENDQTTTFYGHWAANDLTTVLRLSEALEIQKEHLDVSVTEIIGNLDYESNYAPDAKNVDHVFQRCDKDETTYAHTSFEEQGDIEMKLLLDLDKQEITYHYDAGWYDNRPSITMPIPQALETLDKVMKSAEEQGVEEFWSIAWMYTKEIDPAYHNHVEARQAAEKGVSSTPIIQTSDPAVQKLAEEIIEKAAEHGFTVGFIGSADAVEQPPEIEDEEMEV